VSPPPLLSSSSSSSKCDDTVSRVRGTTRLLEDGCSTTSSSNSKPTSITSSRNNNNTNKNNKLVTGDTADWTSEEEEAITKTLQDFVQNTNETEKLRFPKGMGSRRRKLVHYLAVKMELLHWGEGKKGSEKIVVVAKKRSNTKRAACG